MFNYNVYRILSYCIILNYIKSNVSIININFIKFSDLLKGNVLSNNISKNFISLGNFTNVRNKIIKLTNYSKLFLLNYNLFFLLY